MSHWKKGRALTRAIFILLLFLATVSTTAKKKKKGTPDRGAKEQVVSGKVSLKTDEGNFTVVYQIGKLSVGPSCKPKVAPFKGKNVTVTCRVLKGKIITIKSISEAVINKGKKK